LIKHRLWLSLVIRCFLDTDWLYEMDLYNHLVNMDGVFITKEHGLLVADISETKFGLIDCDRTNQQLSVKKDSLMYDQTIRIKTAFELISNVGVCDWHQRRKHYLKFGSSFIQADCIIDIYSRFISKVIENYLSSGMRFTFKTKRLKDGYHGYLSELICDHIFYGSRSKFTSNYNSVLDRVHSIMTEREVEDPPVVYCKGICFIGTAENKKAMFNIAREVGISSKLMEKI